MLSTDTQAWLAQLFPLANLDGHDYEAALTHPSADSRYALRRQQLEWLGDAVLALTVSELLLSRHRSASEADLSIRRSALVNTRALAEIARQIELPARIITRMAEVRTSPNILADTMEALIGALYLSSGLDAVRRFVRERWLPLLPQAVTGSAKGELQRWCRQQGLPLPEYQCQQGGRPERPTFHAAVSIGGITMGTGEGPRKTAAEEAAASAALRALRAGAVMF